MEKILKRLLFYPRSAATAPNLPGTPSIIAASHSTTPLQFGYPPLPTMCRPVSASSSTSERTNLYQKSI